METKMIPVVPGKLVAFNEVRAEIAIYKEENASLVFDYETPEGEKAARSHVYKLRQGKAKVEIIRKKTKADAMAECKAIDAEGKIYVADFNEMIDHHMMPIQNLEDRRQAEIDARLAAEQAEKDRIEKARLDAIAEHEELLARKEAEFKAQAEAAAKAEQEKLARFKAEEDRIIREREILEADKLAEAEAKRREEEAKRRAEIDKKEAFALAEREKQAAIEAEREKARKEADAKAKAEAERVAAENTEKERVAAIDQKRQADESHRTRIEEEIFTAIWTTLDELNPHTALGDGKSNVDIANLIVSRIKENVIPNLTITY